VLSSTIPGDIKTSEFTNCAQPLGDILCSCTLRGGRRGLLYEFSFLRGEFTILRARRSILRITKIFTCYLLLLRYTDLNCDLAKPYKSKKKKKDFSGRVKTSFSLELCVCPRMFDKRESILAYIKNGDSVFF
jgi:hypothetical protein